jgi:hypothetical protein
VPAPQRTYRQVKGERRKGQRGKRTTVCVDLALGYRLDRIEHDALWGRDVSWQAVTGEGLPLSGRGGLRGDISRDDAEEAAMFDASRRYPKHAIAPQWQQWKLPGGESYREWLVMAPAWPQAYFSPHFKLRNVLLHFRVDMRRTASGETALFVQEVQSDWAQGAPSRHPLGLDPAKSPMPLARDWTLLAAKLLLLQAASLGADHLAWTTGEQQVQRWGGLGEQHLRRIYDEALPHAFERLLGCAFTHEEACVSGVEDARQDLLKVHSLALPESVRREILNRGFPAWGTEVPRWSVSSREPG